MATTWDTNAKSSSVALSGGSLIATVGSASGNVLATRALSGPTYFEVAVGSNLTGTASIGLANRAYNFGSTAILLGSDANGCGYRSGGTVLINGTTIATIASYAANSVIGVAVNIVSQLIWFRVGTGNWNNDVIANQNPVGNVGGISLASMSLGSALPACGATFSSVADVFTAAFSSFTNTAPTGYITVDTIGVSATNELRAGVSARQDPVSYSGKVVTGTTTLSGSPVSVRVMLYERNSGRLLDATTSSSVDGSFSLRAYGFKNVVCVAHDDAGTLYRSQVYNSLTPV